MTGQVRRERLVVVGHGMAATRLVEHLAAGGWTRDHDVVVLGDEPVPAYNRILLSAVLEGTHDRDAITLRPARWYAERGVDLRTSARVLALDRERRDVMLVDGTTIGWDHLVLATGSIPTLPPVRGLVRPDGTLDPRVHAFRSLADCDRLLAEVARPEAARPRRAVVVGGGLLGLQVARALALRGVVTEVVEGTEHVLSRQVGPAAGAVLARSLRRLGTSVYTGARAVRLTPEGLRLDNGHVLGTDLVVLTAGGRPSVALARGAGLAVRRGVVVDDRLASVTDDRVSAIGDCAQHGDETTGYVAPAWDQAEMVARRLQGRPARWTGARPVARLRATGLDVAVLGDPQHEPGEVVEVTNPVVGRHARLVVREGRLVAATLVGDLTQVGTLTRLYDQGTVLGPHEAGDLLLPPAAPGGAPAAAPAALPDDAEVCACAGVSAGRLRACADAAEARETTRATTGCGGCTGVVAALVGGRTPVSP